MKRKLNILLGVLVLLSCSASAQVTATLKADSNHIEIGDHLNLKLTIQSPKTHVLQWPKFDGDTLGKIEIIERSKIDTSALGDKSVFTQTLVVSAFDSGSYVISPQAIFFLNQQKATDSVFTNDYVIDVKTLDVDTAKPIKPIKAPLKVSYEFGEFFWWIIAGIVLLALIVAFLLYRKYLNKKGKVVELNRPVEPEHIWALNELKKLEEQKLWQNDQHKLYYSKISDILRSYLEYRYDILAMESTTDEIAKLISSLSISREHQNRLIETLQLADFAKFAKMTPLPDQNMRSMENAKAFVEHTKKKAEQQNTENQG